MVQKISSPFKRTVALFIPLSILIPFGSVQASSSANSANSANAVVLESEFRERIDIEKMNPDLRQETVLRAAGVVTELMSRWNPQLSKEQIFTGLIDGMKRDGIEKGLIAPSLELIDTSLAIGEDKFAAATNLAIAAVNPALSSYLADRLNLPYSDYFATDHVTDESFQKHTSKLMDLSGFKQNEITPDLQQNKSKPQTKSATDDGKNLPHKPQDEVTRAIFGPGSKLADWDQAKTKSNQEKPQAKDINFSQKELAGRGVGPLSGEAAQVCRDDCRDQARDSFIEKSIGVGGLAASFSVAFTPVVGAVTVAVGESWAFYSATKEFDRCVRKECELSAPDSQSPPSQNDAGGSQGQPTSNNGSSGSSPSSPGPTPHQEGTAKGNSKKAPSQTQGQSKPKQSGGDKGDDSSESESKQNKSKNAGSSSYDLPQDFDNGITPKATASGNNEDSINFADFQTFPGQGPEVHSPTANQNGDGGPNRGPQQPFPGSNGGCDSPSWTSSCRPDALLQLPYLPDGN